MKGQPGYVTRLQ